MKRIIATITTGGLVSTIFAASWVAVALMLAVVLILTIALCWILADDKRPTRLATVLKAWRSNNTPQPDPRRPHRERP